MKKFLVRLRKIKRMFFLTEEEFDVEYYKRRVRDTADEVNHMPLKDRLKFIKDVRGNVIENLKVEQEEAKVKYETIKQILREE